MCVTHMEHSFDLANDVEKEIRLNENESFLTGMIGTVHGGGGGGGACSRGSVAADSKHGHK